VDKGRAVNALPIEHRAMCLLWLASDRDMAVEFRAETPGPVLERLLNELAPDAVDPMHLLAELVDACWAAESVDYDHPRWEGMTWEQVDDRVQLDRDDALFALLFAGRRRCRECAASVRPVHREAPALPSADICEEHAEQRRRTLGFTPGRTLVVHVGGAS
jgi:hypothetical protein